MCLGEEHGPDAASEEVPVLVDRDHVHLVVIRPVVRRIQHLCCTNNERQHAGCLHWDVRGCDTVVCDTCTQNVQLPSFMCRFAI